MKGPIRCIICGCHQELACVGSCHWVSMNPPLCSRCNNPEDLRNTDRPADNLLHTQAMTPRLLRAYFKALEMSVSVTKPSRKHSRHAQGWVISLNGSKDKQKQFDELVPALFHDPARIGTQRFFVRPEKYIMEEVFNRIWREESNG